jgi:hypothetical protein
LKLFQEWEDRSIKKTSGGDKIKYDIFYIVRTFVNATMYFHPVQ